jgi:hypothetical protein
MYIFFHLQYNRDHIQQTPRSATQQQERNRRQLDSPEQRRIPQQPINQPPPIPFPLSNCNSNQNPASGQGDDPFAPPDPSPNTARNNLATLRAAADVAKSAFGANSACGNLSQKKKKRFPVEKCDRGVFGASVAT